MLLKTNIQTKMLKNRGYLKINFIIKTEVILQPLGLVRSKAIVDFGVVYFKGKNWLDILVIYSYLFSYRFSKYPIVLWFLQLTGFGHTGSLPLVRVLV